MTYEFIHAATFCELKYKWEIATTYERFENSGKYGAGIIVWKNVKAVIENCLMKKPLKGIMI